MALARTCVVSIVTALVVIATILGSGSAARATQDAPSWSAGDTWEWTWIAGSTGYIRTWTVREQTTLPMASGDWTVWHVAETLVTRSAFANATYANDLWIRPSDFGLAKEVEQTSVGTHTTLWDPPVSQAAFPLNDNAWTGRANVWTAIPTWAGTTTVTTTLNYSGRALPETSITVPSGTFRAVPVLFSEEGRTAVVAYFAASAGNFVLIQSYSGGTVVSTQSLTSYQRAYVAYLVWVAVGLGGVGGVILAVLLVRRIRRARPSPQGKPNRAEPSAGATSSPRAPGDEHSR